MLLQSQAGTRFNEKIAKALYSSFGKMWSSVPLCIEPHIGQTRWRCSCRIRSMCARSFGGLP
ncbi:protein of unknown function [Ralstonia solanacearum CMR15]|nr:protein of unknown function [Ralstonia solanacearum CMR15]